ncbi:MAG: tripartite tricarboxylate transporter substrate binding protein [Xanthobacteraceae bacterium]
MSGQCKIAVALLSALVLAGPCGSAVAQVYPTRAVTIITPSLPGGGIDITARQIAAELQDALHQPFVVENRAGASGNIATHDVARGAPDGYTLLLTISGFQTTNPALFKSLQWDPVRDFAAVAMVSRSPQVLVVNKDSPANTLADLIAYARANPGKVTYGSPGVGTQNNIASLQLAEAAHIKVTTVPYRATAAAFNDLLGGTLGFFVNTTQQLVGPLQGHVVKGLAIFSTKRHPLLPDVPTTAEAGFPDLQIDTWYALYAPAGTPKAVVDRLSGEIRKIVERPDFKARIEKSGATIYYMGSEQLTEYTKQEVAHWRDVVRNLGIPAQSQ